VFLWGGAVMVDCTVSLKFVTYEEFWRYCFGQCRAFKVGCVVIISLGKAVYRVFYI
jgi:hypothetical protein